MTINTGAPNDWVALSQRVAINPRQTLAGHVGQAGQAAQAGHAAQVILAGAIRADTCRLAAQAERRHVGSRGRPHAWLVQDGDVVLPSKWHAALAVQVASVDWLSGAHCTAPPGFLVLRPDVKQLDSVFLAHLLRHLAAPGGALANAAQAACGAVPLQPLLRRLHLCLPPLAQQQAMAAELEQALGQLWQRHAALTAMDQARRLAFAEFFGATSVVQQRWQHAPLGQIVRQILPGKADCRHQPHLPGWQMLLAPHLTWNRLHPAPPQPAPHPHGHAPLVAARAGDVLLSTHRRGSGAAVVPGGLPPTLIGPGLALLRGLRQEPGYLAAFLCSGTGLGEIERVTNHGRNDWLGRQALGQIRVPLPPRAVQLAFLQQRQELDQACNHALAAWQQAQSALQGLQQRVLHGALFYS